MEAALYETDKHVVDRMDDLCVAFMENGGIWKILKIFMFWGIPLLRQNPFKNIKINYANSQIKGELKTNKDGEISGFVADHQVIEEQRKILRNREMQSDFCRSFFALVGRL